MYKMTPSTELDIDIISSWIDVDKYHIHDDPQWWLTGNGVLSFCLRDEQGPVCYVRLDERSDNFVLLHTQFGPIEKRRTALGIVSCLPVVENFCKARNSKGIIFESVSPTLIQFMKKNFGFQERDNNLYELLFQVGI